jgi:hypothetical protein
MYAFHSESLKMLWCTAAGTAQATDRLSLYGFAYAMASVPRWENHLTRRLDEGCSLTRRDP